MVEFTGFLMLCTFIGMAAGALAGALGIGASLVFVPALLLIAPSLGVPAELVPAVCVATGLAASCVVTLSAVCAHLSAGNIERRQVLQARPLLLCAGLGSALGGSTIAHNNSVAVTLGLALAQIVVAIILASQTNLVRPQRLHAGALQDQGHATPHGRPRTYAGLQALAGLQPRLYVGVVGCLTSIGAGGVFLVPYFIWRGLPRVQAAAMACLIGVGITPVATAVFLTSRPLSGSATIPAVAGYVHLPLAASLAAGSLFGARAGAQIAKVAHGAAWSRALAAFLFFASARAIARIV